MNGFFADIGNSGTNKSRHRRCGKTSRHAVADKLRAGQHDAGGTEPLIPESSVRDARASPPVRSRSTPRPWPDVRSAWPRIARCSLFSVAARGQ
jgi:hypothetical protein